MITNANKSLTIPQMGAVIISKHFGASKVSELSSLERHRAYEMLKREAQRAARSLDEYEQKIQHITDYLEL